MSKAPKSTPPLRQVIFAALLLCSCPTALWAERPLVRGYVPPLISVSPTFDGRTLHKLKCFVVDVRWNGLDVKSALEELTEKSRQIDPFHRGIFFGLSLPPGRESETAQAVMVHRKVNLVLTQVTMLEVLAELGHQTNLNATFKQNCVILKP